MGQSVQAQPERDGVRAQVGAGGPAGDDAAVQSLGEQREAGVAQRRHVVLRHGRVVQGGHPQAAEHRAVAAVVERRRLAATRIEKAA
jgi:hypothetical protein